MEADVRWAGSALSERKSTAAEMKNAVNDAACDCSLCHTRTADSEQTWSSLRMSALQVSQRGMSSCWGARCGRMRLKKSVIDWVCESAVSVWW